MNNSTLFDPASQETPEPFDPYALRSDLTDRELLAIFVEALNDYAFIDFIADIISDMWGTEEHATLNAQLHILREALESAAQRTADPGAGGGL